MNELWKRFEDWLSIHWPEGLAALNQPATDAEIGELEAALDIKLPPAFVDCLKVHNGQSASAPGLFDESEFLSTHAILDEWSVWKGLLDSGDFEGAESEPDAGIRSDWWHPKWIPFTHNGSGDHYCLDLLPASGGHAGQVITMWHDMDERKVLAPSFQAWFEQYVDAVLSGDYAYSEASESIVLVNRS